MTATMASTINFTTLFPELFPLVASHLPLYATPLTLRSLALTNHRMYNIIHDLLYSRLILRNEKDALSIFQRILANAELGRVMRELHVMSELSAASINGETAFDTVTGLIRLIKVGYLPYIHTLTLHLSGEWHRDPDEMWTEIIGFGHLPLHFWDDLEDKCPRLRTLILSGLDENGGDPWLNESGIYELKGMKKLTQLGITFNRNWDILRRGPQSILKSVCDLSADLHTLNFNFSCIDDSETSRILSLNFPQLRSLTLTSLSVRDTSESMAFWRRHPLIEKLKLRDSKPGYHWFSETIEGDFLPNLKYLRASFYDVRSLMPILPRLIGLSVHQSLNAQVPYLLRCLIPSGLPNLKSLEIDQKSSSSNNLIRVSEGSRWYETSDGKFHVTKRVKRADRSFTDEYIHSIARGAPNIKELCLHGAYVLHAFHTEKITPQLAEFGQLERLYFKGNTKYSQEDRDAFVTSSQAIAEKCKSLESITDITLNDPLYFGVKIHRNNDGNVEGVTPTEGYGMVIGSEDEAFPLNPSPSVTL